MATEDQEAADPGADPQVVEDPEVDLEEAVAEAGKIVHKKILMKNIIFFFAVIAHCCLGFPQGFDVAKLTVDIFINEAGYFEVVEKYDINFTEEKHGIFREIITEFDFKDENGKIQKRKLIISNIEVLQYQFSTNEVFGKLLNDRLIIKIGDKKKLISGSQHYEIHYRVENGLLFNKNEVILYWNVKSAEWFSFFKDVELTVHLPEEHELSSENCFVYAGSEGISEPSDKFDYTYASTAFSAKSKPEFISHYGQYVTVLVKLPKSMIQESQQFGSLWSKYGVLGFFLLLILTAVGFLKMRLRQNIVVPVISLYPPEGIDPAMAGTLIDNMPHQRDILSLIPYWATKGYILLEEIPKSDRNLYDDLKLIKLKDLPENVPGYEHNLFYKIFKNGANEVLASQTRGVVMEAWKLLSNQSGKYFIQSKKIRYLKIAVAALSWVWAFFSITLLPFLARDYFNTDSASFIVSIILNFLFFFILFPILFAGSLKKKNVEGEAVIPEIQGFYKFIKVAESSRIKALLKEDPYYFEKTMPYAMAFNLLKEWTGKFEGLITRGPSWYTDSSGSNSTMNHFSTSFKQSMTIAKRSMMTSPSSGSSSSRSGGGSSGGGGGRGGGGSW